MQGTTLLEKIKQHTAKVTVIGLGYVGLPLLVEIARAGFHVTGYDKNAERADAVRKGISYIKDVPDEAAVAIALIENIQREDLNAIEEAVALQRLLTEFELTHQQVAEAVGKSRTTVTNLLRLNQLNEDVKRFVEHGDLDMGHARALLALSGPAQSELAKLVAQKGLTVRDTEKLVQKTLEPAKTKVEPVRDPQFGYLERQISEKIGNQVQLQPGKKDSGKLVISYDNLADLDRVLGYFGLSES
mgnify:CR=1 FL=1